MRQTNPDRPIRSKTAEDLGRVPGLSPAETGEMEFRSELTCAIAKIIRKGNLTRAEIAKRAGTARSRVTAIANGNTQGIPTHLMIRVLSAIGHRAELRVRRSRLPDS